MSTKSEGMNKGVKFVLEVNNLLFVNIAAIFLVLVLVENVKRGIISNVISFDNLLIIVVTSGALWLMNPKSK